MADASVLIGWIVFNAVIPLLAPFALLPFAKVPEFTRSRSRGIVRRAIQDGQMLWAAIPISASACYALAVWIDQADHSRVDAWVLLCMHVLLIVAGSVLVLLGTLDAHPRSRRKHAKAGMTLYLSVILSCASAAAYAYAHVALPVNGS